MTTFTVIDFEATTPAIEVATLSLRPTTGPLAEIARFEALIKPPAHAPVTDFDTRTTGIRAADVADQPPAQQVLAELDAALAPHQPMVLVAHHAPTEAGLLHHYRDACPGLAGLPVVDTIAMAKLLLPYLGTYNLDHLLVACKIPRPAHRHRAMPDVEATAALFQTLLDRDTGGAHWPSLEALIKTTARQPKTGEPDPQLGLF
ncbi:3'-5' exonuclease [Saccharopolyspora phatthalungensis]|uniref:DNA polymerase-3 subunit epsilon n=1 Tax=Saccharopolyspora phatthalungensis TaxID=664693 RepID=A0A840QKP3_9PSEU|nr:3'-5' exonuclease [Saccharopolyspora phatthalungensis]MBB5159153.1 DNA polymerase-3 subunit epsilon [Saccharopolyspora phatthalungensis]